MCGFQGFQLCPVVRIKVEIQHQFIIIELNIYHSDWRLIMKHCTLLVNVCIIMVVVVAIVKLSEAQISNTNRPECQGIFDFYFVLDT